ncbi:nuclear transport factor 2 family protein [Flagellimonas zhangzhouensis]|uniref:Ketosteroid isomerase homolog n=1 Tax=Flagellimonas zhangzhouensis TaxID=1073328 RepID=A0A1H2S8Z5_9FLAO|nr:nuclear transport factor 2 family protein [Allomuricauda zhangzhouensis]SDQ72150.1 Ketosteroid isomerase homolog [Allomuricauda zhangzhouensis]SDW28133.1 Ketosteroid isomerase homolog [Allomuricauda zhangzhouensis]
MKKIKSIITLILALGVTCANASNTKNGTTETANDSLRLAELNNFWAEVSRTVNEGDFEGYKATYHEDAVVVFTTGENKGSVTIAKALQNWKQGFIDTKTGKTRNSVEFRFSQRIGDETTAHETGIFAFQSDNGTGNANQKQFVHFNALLIKRDKTWLLVMEYQKSKATEEEWNSLE